MTLALFTHPDCERHDLPGHPEQPARLQCVLQRLDDAGITDEVGVRLAREIDAATLGAVHPAAHVRHIEQTEPAAAIARLDADTFMSPGSLRAGRLAAGACADATLAVLGGAAKRAFCAVRPPGHHAEVATAMGFCLFNNIAVAAELALGRPGVSRVAIVDFDVHHCNGTVDIFKDRPEVLVCSSFQDNFYPYRYLDYTSDHIINLPLAPGSTGAVFRSRIEREWLPVLDAHKPDLLFISAGFDAHTDDPLAQLRLIEADYAWITQRLAEIANRHCGGRIVSTLEGGYDLRALAASAETHVATLLTTL